MARHTAVAGAQAIYVCYEHEETDLLSRVFCVELGYLYEPEDAAVIDKLRGAFREAGAGSRSFAEVIGTHAVAAAAAEQVSRCADRLVLVRGSGRRTDVAALEEIMAESAGGPTLLVVDYLQKVPTAPELANESEKVTRVAEALKDLALSRDVAVVAIVAADVTGLEAKRL